jgi:hypothetical protein
MRAAGQWDKFAMVRFLTLPSSRKDSRSRVAGGELRLGTTAIYMRHKYNTHGLYVKINMLFT